MHDAVYLFSQTSKERKSLARCALSKKNGSKSRSCTLPSDFLTEKQWKERNGEVFTSNLDRPMSYAEWKTLAMVQKWAYIIMLYRDYGARTQDIADMFGVGPSNLIQIFKRYSVEYKALARESESFNRRNPCQKWLDFISENSAQDKPIDDRDETVCQIEDRTVSQPEPVPAEEAVGFVRGLGGSLRFEGTPEAVFREVMRYLSPNAMYRMEIDFTQIGEGIV